MVRKRLIAHERFRNLADGVRNAMSPSVLQFVRELNTASAAVPCPSRCNSSSASYVLKQVEADFKISPRACTAFWAKLGVVVEKVAF